MSGSSNQQVLESLATPNVDACGDLAGALALDELLHRCMGSEPLAQKLLTSFETRFANEVAQLANCLHDGDVPRLVRLTHQLKGAAANVSALALHRLLESLEQSARDKQLDAVTSRLPELYEQGERFARAKAVAMATMPTAATARVSILMSK